jgi:alpha-galactosidase/6-phospho-beta-glucosidase family protein
VIGDRAARKRMNSPTLRARIADLEDSRTERKQGVQSHDEIRKAVVSFANSVPEGHTAVLFIGVANDGTVTGVATDKTRFSSKSGVSVKKIASQRSPFTW